jgi:hypothetical protein
MVIAEAKYEMHTSLMASICTLLFFTFFSFLRKYLHVHRNRTLQIQDKSPFHNLKSTQSVETRPYQNLLLAQISLVAQRFMR